jgi:hypothetical protein
MPIREQEIPTCPGCGKSDRVEYHGRKTERGLVTPSGHPDPLANWWCARCVGWLSALPALPATGRVSEAGPKRRKGAGDERPS